MDVYYCGHCYWHIPESINHAFEIQPDHHFSKYFYQPDDIPHLVNVLDVTELGTPENGYLFDFYHRKKIVFCALFKNLLDLLIRFPKY